MRRGKPGPRRPRDPRVPGSAHRSSRTLTRRQRLAESAPRGTRAGRRGTLPPRASQPPPPTHTPRVWWGGARAGRASLTASTPPRSRERLQGKALLSQLHSTLRQQQAEQGKACWGRGTTPPLGLGHLTGDPERSRSTAEERAAHAGGTTEKGSPRGGVAASLPYHGREARPRGHGRQANGEGVRCVQGPRARPRHQAEGGRTRSGRTLHAPGLSFPFSPDTTPPSSGWGRGRGPGKRRGAPRAQREEQSRSL